MPVAASNPVHKHFRLNPKKLKLAQKALDATTETETVERALDLVISEYERNRVTEKAHREFLMSGAKIRDVFGSLDE